MNVCDGQGNARAFVCPYHAWTYELDGRLRHAPEMDKTPGFETIKVRLPEVRHEVWEGFVFVNVSGDAPALADSLIGPGVIYAESTLKRLTLHCHRTGGAMANLTAERL